MGRMERCGAAIVLPTYPAWSIGAKYPNEPVAPGPGTGKYGPRGEWSNVGPAHGPPRAPKQKPPKEPYTPPPKPVFRLAPQLPIPPPVETVVVETPGPTSYNVFKGLNLTAPRVKSSSWGPPPRTFLPPVPPPRPETPPRRMKKAPPPVRPTTPPQKDPTPGPADYCPYPRCKAGCCSYKGPTFGHRVPEPDRLPYPGPGQYHVACTTLGAAAQGCDSAGNTGHSHHHDHHHSPTQTRVRPNTL